MCVQCCISQLMRFLWPQHGFYWCHPLGWGEEDVKLNEVLIRFRSLSVTIQQHCLKSQKHESLTQKRHLCKYKKSNWFIQNREPWILSSNFVIIVCSNTFFKCRNFFTSWTTITFLKKGLVCHGVSYPSLTSINIIVDMVYLICYL